MGVFGRGLVELQVLSLIGPPGYVTEVANEALRGTASVTEAGSQRSFYPPHIREAQRLLAVVLDLQFVLLIEFDLAHRR